MIIQFYFQIAWMTMNNISTSGGLTAFNNEETLETYDITWDIANKNLLLHVRFS